MRPAPLFKTFALVGLGALLLLLPLWLARRPPIIASDRPRPLQVSAAPAVPPPDYVSELGAGFVYPATPLLRPLPVARTSADHEWTQGDGLSPDVIRLIAHNADEFRRLIEENDRIQRRQLVYRKDVVAAAVQRSRLTGAPVRRLVLPGFDGREFAVDVVRADLSPSGQSGSFTGKLAGSNGSMVTLAFKFGREAFTILSPETGEYLQGHPRESGEVIVTGFDPDRYAPQQAGEPILTHE